MLKRKKLVSIATIVLIGIIGTGIFFTQIPVQSSPGPSEPSNLKDLVEFPSPCSADLTDFDVDIFVWASFARTVEGLGDIASVLQSQGFTSFDVFGEDKGTNVNGTVDGTNFSGNATGGWSFENVTGGRALFVLTNMSDGTDIVVAAITNLLPPSQKTGGYNIQNAMPYVYIKFYWWAWSPINKTVSWEYWWYDSHSHPNWFWSCYWWWRDYLRSYSLQYNDWHWWFWHWYYWKFWYWWSTNFPYS